MHSPTGLIFGALSMLLAAPPGSYIRYKLFELAASADTIVSGAISDVNENTFEFEIHGVVAGQVSKSIRVRLHRRLLGIS